MIRIRSTNDAVGKRCTSIDIVTNDRRHGGLILIHRQRCSRTTAVAGDGWRIVRTLDGDRDLRGAGQTCGVTHRIGEDILQCVTASTKGLNRRVIVIDRVSVRTVRSDIDRAKGTSHVGGNIGRGTGNRTCSHTRYRASITRVDVRVVGEYIAGGIGTRGSVANATSFYCSGCVCYATGFSLILETLIVTI